MHSRAGYPHLLSILATCVYLGVKVTDGPKFACQLSGMLTNILGPPVSPEMVRCAAAGLAGRAGGGAIEGVCWRRGAARVPCFSSLAVVRRQGMGGMGQSSA
jgi:hypothetical protein